MTDHELLLAMSTLFDKKLKPIEQRLKSIELTIENDIRPQLQNIESCYTTTYDRYKNSVEGYETMQADIDIMKKVISEHSEKLQMLA
ncbi:MAG: hypothetical protein NC432_07585 [Roseburia sp.]|nr:hypothetical protein [Roseburia sp.]MCM1098581.1 hypothetical protein [Ruminococcus flavefaciens]